MGVTHGVALLYTASGSVTKCKDIGRLTGSARVITATNGGAFFDISLREHFHSASCTIYIAAPTAMTATAAEIVGTITEGLLLLTTI